MRLIPIRPENAHLAWKDIEKHIKSGLEYTDGKYKLEDIYDAIIEQSMILWVVYNDERERAIGCVLTETLQYPRIKALSIFLLAGDNFDEIVLAFDELKEYAKSIGCSTIEFYGRPGWEKILKPHSFVKTHIVMRFNL